MTSMISALLFPTSPPLKSEPAEQPLKPRRGNPKPNHQLANEAKIEAARKRYKAVMGDEWVATKTIESRLGRGRGTVYETLTRFVARGELTRRPLDGKPYRKRGGYEWKWEEK